MKRAPRRLAKCHAFYVLSLPKAVNSKRSLNYDDAGHGRKTQKTADFFWKETSGHPTDSEYKSDPFPKEIGTLPSSYLRTRRNRPFALACQHGKLLRIVSASGRRSILASCKSPDSRSGRVLSRVRILPSHREVSLQWRTFVPTAWPFSVRPRAHSAGRVGLYTPFISIAAWPDGRCGIRLHDAICLIFSFTAVPAVTKHYTGANPDCQDNSFYVELISKFRRNVRFS